MINDKSVVLLSSHQKEAITVLLSLESRQVGEQAWKAAAASELAKLMMPNLLNEAFLVKALDTTDTS